MIKTCRSKGCNREPWKDGYCRKCSDFDIQQLNIKAIHQSKDIIFELITRLERVEQKLDIAVTRPIFVEENQIKNKIIKEEKVEEFIPTIKTPSNSNSNIKLQHKNKSISSKKLKNAAEQLQKIQKEI
jgi:hypothetical protein